ncbi:DUF4232 domain-containing protein [Streptomyces sp. 5-8]|uniref:DUF4232 domain-containing protein n=1 Tax=Streptomyces musisoli TaxID=2802280 RepID=A0ABS1NWS1_9ACTN|nr:MULTISPECIES: DUF4232 domain-containing protein [Streptomyces]MBL1104272.1 DUF4232 domain-containing protein [Streptomyces musisoli]MBY8844428.1 DUF4232 domain-containing protein [Streptomyces sp. SP2-10]
MRKFNRFTTPAAAPSVLVAALALVGGLAAAQSAEAAPGKAAKAATINACSTAQTKLTVTQVTRPINHLLLKATNTGTQPCNAYGAPYLKAGADAQAAVAWNDATVPQAVVTLAPGESAYAGITTSTPDGVEGYTAKTLGVFFSNRAMNGSVGAEKTLKLPGDGVYFNSAATVTYWQDNVDNALFD